MTVIDVKSEITGIVSKILKSEDDIVEEDEPIIILESMKMEIPVTAPEDGSVVEVLVEQEASVAEGQVVARIKV